MGSADIGPRPVLEIDERRSAREAIELAVVGVTPIDRAVGLDQRSGDEPDRIIAVELAFHIVRQKAFQIPTEFASGLVLIFGSPLASCAAGSPAKVIPPPTSDKLTRAAIAKLARRA